MTALVVFAGQSNAVGFGMSSATLPGHLSLPNPTAYIFDGNFWGVLTPGVNTGTPMNPNAWGPEAQFAYDFGLAHPGELLLIVKNGFTVKGQTGLAQASGQDWSPNSLGEMFDLTDATIEAAQRAFLRATGSPAPPVSAVFWMQGEEDALSAAKASAYQSNFEAWVSAVRSDWMDNAQGYIGAGRITDSAALPFNADVRVGQWAADQPDPYLATFKTIGFGLQPDTVHYDAGGLQALGSAFFTLFDGWF